MGRYLLKFSKENNLKYISHLDLLRLFQRAFKRAKIQLRYSQGYNPHAKIAFCQPLSLGYESVGEYMEFETTDSREGGFYLERLAACMPVGIRLLACSEMSETSKTSLAAVITHASYVTRFYGGKQAGELMSRRLAEYIRQESIICEKLNKKKKVVEIDIRPLILSFSLVSAPASASGADSLSLSASVSASEADVSSPSVPKAPQDDGETVFSMTLRTGSAGNLNPEMLVRSFCEFCGVEYIRHQWNYRRTEMFFQPENGRGLAPLTEFAG